MRTVVASGNLYELALQEYGDATQWNVIAQANGLLDPMLVGIATLIIPDSDPTQTGGVLVR